ncbi:DUF7059 domain-containing protein [Arthrobacter sp. H41]|uniref:DUF7059 domain-containing protein n=1 Tax=Arthrobacter sp. H41 TaxID=1312978 RepID=UPI0004B91A1A|nr:methyltransferase [Arthrobacter sp. H41]
MTIDIHTAPAGQDPGLLAALAADLTAASYTVDGVDALLGSEASAALGRDQPVPALLRCRSELEELEELEPGSARRTPVVPVLLWLLGQKVSEDRLDAAFPALKVAGLAALRLIEPAGDGWRAAAELRPYSSDVGGDLWVASDVGAAQRPGALRSDHVLGIGGASLTLARSIIRDPVDTALDLGTGCGIQAFHLLAHARHVTATDISERALAFARFNLLLNADALSIDPARLDDRVSLRLGSMLDPVADDVFDLVVSNPPFVITPRRPGADQYTYRDGGLAGDDVVSSLLRSLPGVLKPGGTAQLLGNWEIPAGAHWDERLRAWFAADVDAWVIQREQLSPVQYAETWLRDAAENRDPETYVERYREYLADFGMRGVEGIGFGMVWLRRPAEEGKTTIRRFEEVTHEVEQPLGPHLGAALAREDWAATQGGNAGAGLGEQYLLVADDVTEERHQRPGAEHPGVILLRQGGGLRRTTLLSTELAGFASACDGELTAGQIAGALAALLHHPEDEFVPGLLAEVEQLVIDGFLIPAP